MLARSAAGPWDRRPGREKHGNRGDEAGRSAVRYLVSRFFRNSRELLVLNLLEDEQLDEKELQRIRHLIAEESK